MASTSEVGHAKNVANFQNLMAFVNGYGATYNPSKNDLSRPKLEALYAQANAHVAEVINKNTAYYNAVNQRVEAFSGLRSLSTRLVNALESTNASKEKIDDAKGFNRKMQGRRASKKEVSTDPNQPAAPKTISASQQSTVQMIQHFEGLISVLQSESSYTPNESELSMEVLQSKLQELKVKNEQVAKAYTAVSNARVARDKTLSNMINIAAEVKKYVKSVFGANSPEFAQIKGIPFKKEQ
ncbi:hypothetical protein QLS71_015475 [Mariniflexile litorale]|uniref:Uncharacterized protein n=1 Tax=Mariniflexile litorale TaxID=3045158 RepID=A0AAU7EDQ3_9FLAO|nr:hypothetical protein [Mariniflexile sp. KMM 9835]MDQ8212456.1 hypothetical protein [Mariniflexile sp. KMM 9835]